MSNSYKIKDNDGLYFITITVVGWVDLFVRKIYNDLIIESLEYCINNKGLKVHAYVIMSSHIHAIVSTTENNKLVSTIRDFKKFTSKKLVETIKETNESRREWLLNKFEFEAKRIKRAKNYVLWQSGYHAKQLESNHFLEQKLNYIHENPVKEGIVFKAEDYVYSSAINYCGEMGVLKIDLLK